MQEEFMDKNLLEEARVEELYDVRVKKFMRKIIPTLIGLFLVFFIPVLFPRYNDFNVVSRSIEFRWMLYISFFITVYTLFTYLKKERTKKSIKHMKEFKRVYDIFDLSSFVVYIMTALVLVNTFLFSFTNVDGKSMEPTLTEGDDLVIYHLNVTYQRFDIVVIKVASEQYYIKRIIGLPGDEITYQGDTLFVNGELIEEPFILGFGVTCDPSCSYTVPENSYFVLGDNRSEMGSEDSRSLRIGFISEEQLYGKAVFRLRPVGAFGRLE